MTEGSAHDEKGTLTELHGDVKDLFDRLVQPAVVVLDRKAAPNVKVGPLLAQNLDNLVRLVWQRLVQFDNDDLFIYRFRSSARHSHGPPHSAYLVALPVHRDFDGGGRPLLEDGRACGHGCGTLENMPDSPTEIGFGYEEAPRSRAPSVNGSDVRPPLHSPEPPSPSLSPSPSNGKA